MQGQLSPNHCTFLSIFFYSTKLFVRWMHGTCIETPAQHLESEDEPVIFSFFKDVSAHPQVLDLVVHVSKMVQGILGGLNKYLNKWKRYRRLWSLDKVFWITFWSFYGFLGNVDFLFIASSNENKNIKL